MNVKQYLCYTITLYQQKDLIMMVVNEVNKASAKRSFIELESWGSWIHHFYVVIWHQQKYLIMIVVDEVSTKRSFMVLKRWGSQIHHFFHLFVTSIFIIFLSPPQISFFEIIKRYFSWGFHDLRTNDHRMIFSKKLCAVGVTYQLY